MHPQYVSIQAYFHVWVKGDAMINIVRGKTLMKPRNRFVTDIFLNKTKHKQIYLIADIF